MKRTLGLLSTVALVVALSGLGGCGEVCSSDLDVTEPVDLGIDADLHAVVGLDLRIDDRLYEFLAVGASGTVVIWGHDFTGEGAEAIFEVFDVGDRDLHAAWMDEGNSYSYTGIPWGWWVVGDGATLMASNNRGALWDTVELPTDADLYGITPFEGRPIVVGDDVIAMRTVDGTWTVLTPPMGGWGQLRGISFVRERIEVVGLGGVIWSAVDPSGAWTLEPSGVTTDLFAVSYGRAAGSEGTLLRYQESGWTRVDTGVDVDLVAFGNNRVLGANGEIYEMSEPLELVDTHPGARGISRNHAGWATVGDGGLVNSAPSYDCD